MSKFVGGFVPITEEGIGWQTVGELKKALEDYPDDFKLCFVQSTGPAETVEIKGEKSEETFAPFDFEIEDGVLYIPIYDGKILTLVQNAENREREENNS